MTSVWLSGCFLAPKTKQSPLNNERVLVKENNDGYFNHNKNTQSTHINKNKYNLIVTYICFNSHVTKWLMGHLK